MEIPLHSIRELKSENLLNFSQVRKSNMTELTKVTPLVEKKQEVDEFTWLPISIPRPPARLLLIGSSGCGKSN